jgi:hypothetical protein
MEDLIIPKQGTTSIKYVKIKCVLLEQIATPSNLQNIFSWGNHNIPNLVDDVIDFC